MEEKLGLNGGFIKYKDLLKENERKLKMPNKITIRYITHENWTLIIEHDDVQVRIEEHDSENVDSVLLAIKYILESLGYEEKPIYFDSDLYVIDYYKGQNNG